MNGHVTFILVAAFLIVESSETKGMFYILHRAGHDDNERTSGPTPTINCPPYSVDSVADPRGRKLADRGVGLGSWGAKSSSTEPLSSS
jgi:hypothetical protein